ncbi:MAG: DUF2452 domain-containing protein [Halioglobus sp.]
MNKKKSARKNPNPQGKGMVPILRDWGALQPGAIGQKSAAVFLRDYCLSALVLAAKFRFKPVIGKPYFLYLVDDQWSLSMIAPEEWGERLPGEFFARCTLQADMTWDVQVCKADEASDALSTARGFVRSFVTALGEQSAIVGNLPYYVSGLPYYPRLLATALAASLQRSLPPSGDDMQALLATVQTDGIAWVGATESGMSSILERDPGGWPIISS